MSRNNADQGQGPKRLDVMDVVEGFLRDGVSLSSFTRVARASGSNFWLGAAIGVSVVVLAQRPELRAALSGILHGHTAKPGTPGDPRDSSHQ